MPRKRPPPWWGVWGWSPPPTRMGTLALLVVLLSQQVLGQQQLNIETQEFSITEELEIGSSVGFINTRPGFTYTFNQVRIKVLDKNDNAPTFSSSYTQLSFSESSQIGSRLILETASDPDEGENGRIVDYFISGGNEAGKFGLKLSENTGNQNQYLYLETIAQLDTEEQEVYNLNITAVDGGNPSMKGSTVLSIKVLDINDNAPVFSEPEYKAALNETSPVGAFVVQVSAVDKDKGENSRVSFAILNSGQAKLFRIDSDTGVITTAQPLQCPGNVCTLTLAASDHGVPKQESEATVVVKLIDANDHSPQISYSYFPDQNAKFATVEENAKAGSLVAAITVTDKDKGENGKTDLDITQGNEFGHFRLDTRGDIHILRVDSQLDRETITEYNLTIVARDMGNPPRTSTSYLLVKVNDINDHPPVFTSNVYTAVLSEAAPLGSFVAAPLAVDADSGVNSNIYYSIVEGNDLQWFEIQHESGLITTSCKNPVLRRNPSKSFTNYPHYIIRMRLDRERLEEVSLKVSARDGGTNPKYADTLVNIIIQDINDQTPTFTKNEISTSVTEHTSVGTRLITLVATDKDKGDNGTVRYSISSLKPASSNQPFKLDPISGDLTVNLDLDREADAKYELVVTAYDLGQPVAKTSTATITVDIGDINDNDPVLYPKDYHVVLHQADFQQSDLVVQLRAQDPDFGANAEISYEINAGNDGDVFRLDEATGQLFMNRPITELSQDVYTLKVSARKVDGKGRKSPEPATVEILIDNGNLDYYSCTEDLYTFSIQEDSSNAQLGRQVGVVRVSDPTNSIPDARYTITDGDEKGIFSISETTGVILTQRDVDREAKEKYTLKVNVKSGLRLINAVCIAKVLVTDINDNIPQVLNHNEISVKEDAPIGEVITVLNVQDPDKGVNAEHKFKMLTENQFFTINENTGAVIVTQPLEESRTNKVKLEFEVSDQGTNQLKTRFAMTVTIEDINDHTPYFDQDTYELSVPEDTLVNSKLFLLKATDADRGDNGFVSYDITEGNNKTFGIFPDGNVYLKMKLDREMNDYYTLTVRAKDNGTPERSSTVSLTVHVDDINDNPPKFVQSKYQFTVGENEGDKIFIGKIHATDADMGRNAELTYRLEDAGGSQKQFFTVEPRTGFIFTKQSLDREQLFDDLGSDSISFEVLVSDNGLPVKNQDSATVTVQVFDENDNTPEFASKSYISRISENLSVGSEVISVFAADPDLNDNGKVKYAIERGDRNDVFKIDTASGVITLAKPLDRETVDDYTLLISAEDHGKPARSSSVAVSIVIMDENDNRPKILNNDLVLTLAEDIHVGQEVYKFIANDNDIGENADVRFSLGDGGYNRFFRLDSLSGSLYLQQPLDYEKDPLFALKVIASDQGTPSLSDSVDLKVRVTDVNDNAPQFPNTAIVRQIQEGIPANTPILTMEATDADSGDNGRVRYSLAGYKAGAMDKFEIDPLTGVVRTIGDIDREQIDTYEFTVVATDLAEPKNSRLKTEKVVTIIVEDVNDNSPEFDSVPTGKLSRGTQTGQTIVTVQASDPDANSNGRVTYKLQQDSFLFKIDHFSGDIRLQNRPEKLESVYQLIVVASDEAVQSARKSATATVTILGLETETQGRGFLEPEYVARIEEESGPGQKVVELQLRGGNTGARFYIMTTKNEGGSSRNIFSISPNGVLESLVNIDREIHGDRFDLEILAVHSDNSISTCKVTVYVDDLNDTAPKFLNPPHIKISENTLPGEVVYTLDAFDADSNSILKYSMISGNADIFDLAENSGELRLKVNVDRETVDEYEMRVRVSDGAQFADINLIIMIGDENDNIPEFTNSIFSFELSETSPKGTLVGKVAASDADLGLNSEVDYQLITEWGKDVFSLDPATGVFTLTSELDYERNEHYIFVVSGQDRGTPQLSSTVTVYINVKDVNDNSPEFKRSTYTTSVPENIVPGAGILDLEATDLDSGDNGRIQYSIIGEAEEVFSVLQNGTLVSKQPLDREQQANYEFVVKAIDGGKSTVGAGRNSATTTVKLSLEDINDSVPEITSPLDAYVLENQPVNTVVMPVTVVDRDTGSNADIEYFITNSDSDAFDIGRLDGILRTQSVLDREARSMYVLTVTVMDMGRPRLSSSAEIKIHVVDTNDNTPTFQPRQYSTTLMENATIGQNILETTAFDADSGPNGDIRYTIVSGDKTRDFTIGEHSGVLRVNRKLEFERKNAYQLTIQAEDSGDPVKYDTASVSIYIEDVNDSAPKFLDTPYHVRVVEGYGDINQGNGNQRRTTAVDEQLPRYITRLQATDPDNPPHNVIKYTMKESYGNKFSVNASTGDIFLHSTLDRESESSYEIQIVAIDTGNPRLSSTGTLSVIVEDVNDHAPQWSQKKFRVKINENEKLSDEEPLISVKATDLDEGNNGEVRYSLFGEDSGKFKIDEDGNIYSSWTFDREEKSSYSLTLLAKDMGEEIHLESSAELIVDILDNNDNAPVLVNGKEEILIPSDLNIGGFVYKLDAFDLDSGDNGRIQFSWTNGQTDRFRLDRESGTIYLANQLNQGQTYTLNLQLVDQGQPTPLSSQSALTFRSADPSQFPAFSEPQVSEIFVTENDIEANLPKFEANGLNFQTINYGICAGNVDSSFNLDQNSGRLMQIKPLDFEQNEKLELYICAYPVDEPTYKTYHKFTVNIKNVNDNPPEFEKLVYLANVTEEAYPPVTVVKLTAQDKDSNSGIRYSLKTTDDPKLSELFEVDSTTGEVVTLAKLDRETSDNYDLVVQATDEGALHTTETLIRVKVEDINDNPPRFTRILSINITEDTPKNSVLATVNTIDKDIGANANVTYKFAATDGDVETSKFTIDPFTGDITLVGELDREVEDEYLLKVVATDGAWRAETTVGITVQDVNDNMPVFERPDYVFRIPATTNNYQVIGRVIATDDDITGPNSQVIYRLRESLETFSIDSTSGEILTRQRLANHDATKTRTVENEYLLEVVAEDSGKPPLSSTCTVKILVMDENLGAPEFEKSNYTAAIPLDANIGYDIITVTAYDNVDVGLNAEIEYYLEDSTYFEIDKTTGQLKLKGFIENKPYAVTVIAKDLGVPEQSTTAEVVIMPSGDNLHTPQFTVANTQIIVPEDKPLGKTNIQVKATDADSGINGIVRFAIVGGNEDEMFDIDEVTGEIIINKHLDYDKVKGFVLIVEARDLATNPKSSNSTLAINLTDVNDNVPFFELHSYDAYIQENMPQGTSIVTMKAIDLDSPRFATILYTIQEPEMSRHFGIDEATGEITSARSFDYETENEYVMHITARNPESNQFNTTKLTIHITGSNEFYPRFQQPVFQFSVSESALPDSEVGQVQAFDQDAGPEGEIFYFLVGPSNDYGFYIEKETGIIFIKEILDREFQNRFVLTVLAKNEGNIYGNDTDEAQVIIQVQDGNDPPVFRSDLYEAEIDENSALGTVVTTVAAVDRDVRPRNSQFSYSILSGNTDDAFEIDPNIGSIRTIKNIDRESVDRYEIIVAAIDNGNPPQTGTAMVNIQIKDVNDNPPRLDVFNRRGSLKENSQENTLVAKLQPVDDDLPPNGGPFRFRIVGGKHQDWFTIDGDTGDIKSTVSVDREVNPELEILVEVSDSGNPSLSDKYPIIIDILDENDNPSEPRVMTVLVQTLNGDFPGGVVAPVRPKDPDTTGQYDCKIKTGPKNLFQMKPDCYLHTGRLMNVNNYNLSVIGNDGIHETVTSQVYLTFDKFDQTVQEKSVAIRVQKFIESDKIGKLFWYLSSLTSSNSKVQVLSVDQNEISTDFYVGLRSGKAYESKDNLLTLLKSKFKINDVLLDVDTIIGYGPCLDEPCQNQGNCYDSINIEDTTIIVESEDVILNAPKFHQKYTCSCPEKFEGKSCELDADPCEPNPCQGGAQCVQFGYDYECQCPALTHGKNCQLTKSSSCDQNPCLNGGTCRESNLGGSFFCLCRPGYQGSVCEEPLDPCQPNPCKNGGECVSKKPNYKCKCPDNFYGTNCEKSTFGFSELSYMKFPALDSNTNDIEITFSTMKTDSLLVYNFGQQSGGRSDFIAIELINGKAVFSFGGARTAITRITVDKYLANGRWHKVTATRNNRVASLSVSDCAESGEFCKLCKAGDEKCFAKDIGESGTLNFNNNPLFFGGIDEVQEIVSRVGQVASDDFIGCFKSLSINGQQLNLKTGFIESRGILASCPIPGSLCAKHNCQSADAECVEINWKPVCKCSTGVIASNCDSALAPVSLEFNGTVSLKPTELHKRQQLFKPAKNANENQDIGFRFRTEINEGRIFYSESKRNTEFTTVYIREGALVYETRKDNFPQINVTSPVQIIDGAWHHFRLVQERNTVKVYLDDVQLGYDLEADSTHNILDPYLNKLTFGGKRTYTEGSFRGCLENFTINGEVQALGDNGIRLNQLFANNTFTGKILNEHIALRTVNFDCLPGFLSVTAGSDPVNVGVVIVIAFFIILILAILGSFFAFKLKKNKLKDAGGAGNQGGNTSLHQLIDNKHQTSPHQGGHLNQGYASNTFNRVKKMPTQKPDIIERQIVNDSPLGRGGFTPTPRGDLSTMGGDYSASMLGGGLQDSEQPEHYDIENASSIAPSDIDIIYHYKDYRDGGRHARELNNMGGWGKFSPAGGGKSNNSPIRLNALGGNSAGKLQSTPLARLSPSSDLSHQTPRILTLQDISGKAHPSALLQQQQQQSSSPANHNRAPVGGSSRKAHHPFSHHIHQNSLTDNNGDSSDDNLSDLNSSARNRHHQRRKKANGSKRTDNTRPAASSPNATNLKHNKFKDLLETNTELLDTVNDSSDDSPSENDSFTCSEYDYEAPSYSIPGAGGNGPVAAARPPDAGTPGGMVFRKLNGDSNDLGKEERLPVTSGLPGAWTASLDRDQTGSLSTLNVSDDDLSGITSPSGPASWETLLNWNPNFTSFLGVFKDIAELPDSNCDIRPSPLGNAMATEGEEEEYI